MRAWVRKHPMALVLTGAFVGCIIVILVLAIGLSYRTYQHVKGPLRTAQNTLTALAHNPESLNSATGRADTERSLATAASEVASAQRQIEGSFGLKVLGLIPGLHTQRAGLDQLVADLHATTVTATQLLGSVNTLATASHGVDVSLPDLKELGAVLGTARDQLRVEDRSASGLWGPIGADRQKFDHEDTRAVRLLAQGHELTQYAFPFLGGDGPRTYLVMGENNAEMRDQGAPLSYSLLHADNGSITESPGGSVDLIELHSPAPGVSIPAGTQKIFGALNPTQTWQSANFTADFSFSGQDMQAMFAAATGQHVDGVIGIDVVAVQKLLGLTGPVTVSGVPEPVTTENAANVLLNQLYAGVPLGSSQGPRREELAAVVSATFHRLQTDNVDVVALARTLATEVAGRHLLLWDEDPAYEKTLLDVGASGAVDTDDPTRTFHVVVEDGSADKLDYFVDVAISDTIYLTPSGAADVDTSVTLTNHAPAGQHASYQFGPDGENAHVPGQYVGRVFLWGPRGSDQGPSTPESGLLLAPELDLSILPGQSAVAQFETTIPHAIRGGKLRLDFVPQPRLSPESLTVRVVAKGLKSGTPSVVRTSLTDTRTLTWDFPELQQS